MNKAFMGEMEKKVYEAFGIPSGLLNQDKENHERQYDMFVGSFMGVDISLGPDYTSYGDKVIENPNWRQNG